jgi:hypothetical protein
MASLLGAVARVKRDALAALDRTAVERACDELGYEWRDRELDPATTVALFVQQVLHGNVSCGEVRHLPAGKAKRFTGPAYCQARSRLPLRVLQTLLTGVVDAALPATRLHEHRWLGRHRVFHVDGSTFSMPDTPELRKAFGTPSGQRPGCGFPVAHLLVLFNAQTGLLVDAWAGPLRTGDVAQTPEAHLHLDAGDVLVGDDSFSGYAHLASLASQNLHALLPVHHLRIVDFTKGRPHRSSGGEGKDDDDDGGVPTSRWIKSLGKEDQLVEYFKPKRPALWMTRAEHDALPDSVVVRELRRTVERPGMGRVTLTMMTTLTDPKAYPAEALLELRLRRWDVETDLRHLKTTMGLDVLRVQERTGRAQGAGGLLPGLQPGPHRDAGGRPPAGGAGVAGELRRRAALDAPRTAWRPDARLGPQPVTPEPRRAAVQEAPRQAIRPDEQAARRTAQSPRTTAENALT